MLPAQGEWHGERGVHVEQPHARGAVAEGLLGRRPGAERTRTVAVDRVALQQRMSDIAFAGEAGLPAAGIAALHRDFGVIDVVAAAAGEGFDADRVFAVGIAVDDAGELDVVGVAGAAVDVVLGVAGHALVVAVVAVVQGQRPVTEGDGIVDGVALVAVVARIQKRQVPVVADVEQIVQGQWIVVGERDAALVAAGGRAAAIVGGQCQAKGKALFVVDQDVGIARGRASRRGGDLDVGRRGGRTPEVLQRLVEIMDVEQIARARRKRSRPVAPAIPRIHLHAPYAPRNDGKPQYAGGQVLRADHDPAGDVAGADQGVLRPFLKQPNAFYAQAFTDRAVVMIPSRQATVQPGKCLVVEQTHLTDGEAGTFPFGQAKLASWTCLRLEYVGMFYQLLALRLFPLLLAAQFGTGIGRGLTQSLGLGNCGIKARNCHKQRERQRTQFRQTATCVREQHVRCTAFRAVSQNDRT